MGLVKFIAGRLRLLRKPHNKHYHQGQRSSRQLIGQVGENLAAQHLKYQGMKLLYRNFRATHGGEVDIIARDGKILAFVEVKTRTSEDYGRPVDAVNMDKRYLIARGAFEWMRRLGSDGEKINYRFDVVEVLLEDGKKDINLIKGAFETPDSYLNQ